jgi:molybdenum cofactor synthesis domain-containing protein
MTPTAGPPSAEGERVATRVGIVIIGDEVLKREVVEKNVDYLLGALNDAGADVLFVSIVPDDIDDAVSHLAFLRPKADLVLLTGGIGPTPDDLTRDIVARAAGVRVVRDAAAEELLRSRYPDRVNDAMLLMADVPLGSELIPKPLSTAPGFFVGGMAAFPGIPALLQGMFPAFLASLVERGIFEGRRKAKVTLHTDAPESRYAGIMRKAMDGHATVSVGSYPEQKKIPGTDVARWTTRVVFRADEFNDARACADGFEGDLLALGYTVGSREEEKR